MLTVLLVTLADINVRLPLAGVPRKTQSLRFSVATHLFCSN